MPDWSCSYRQGNSEQLSEIIEAHSDDAYKMTTFVEAINKTNPLETNYYSASNRSRLAKRHFNKDSAHKLNEDDEEGGLKYNAMEKAQSFSKPILPRLNIERVKEENQNVLPFKGFHDITRNKSTRTPHLSVGLPKVGAIGDVLNVGVGDGEASDIKEASSRRDDASKAEYLKNLAKRYEESYYTTDVPRYKMLRSKENEGFSQSKKINMTLRSNFASQMQRQRTCSCQLESKFLIMKKLSQQKEEAKLKDPGYKEHTHETMFESYMDDKMRL